MLYKWKSSCSIEEGQNLFVSHFLLRGHLVNSTHIKTWTLNKSISNSVQGEGPRVNIATVYTYQ